MSGIFFNAMLQMSLGKNTCSDRDRHMTRTCSRRGLSSDKGRCNERLRSITTSSQFASMSLGRKISAASNRSQMILWRWKLKDEVNASLEPAF